MLTSWDLKMHYIDVDDAGNLLKSAWKVILTSSSNSITPWLVLKMKNEFLYRFMSAAGKFQFKSSCLFYVPRRTIALFRHEQFELELEIILLFIRSIAGKQSTIEQVLIN